MFNGLTKEAARRLVRPALLLGLVAGPGAPAAAQVPGASVATKTLRAHRIAAPIRVDGVLDENGWRQADAASDFVQQDLHVNEPVSERTEVRVLIDEEALYVGIECHDSDPHGIIARELRRDNPVAGDDHVEILLDTFHDHRNAFHFAVNPLGTQYDALITDEGHDIDAEWNERWWSAARITTTRRRSPAATRATGGTAR